MSEPLQTHELQHVRLPYPSLSPRVCPNSSPLIQWCHLTISVPFSSFFACPQSFPASFLMSQFSPSGGQSIGASASVLPKNEGWFPLRLTDLISLLSKGLSRIFSSTTIWKHQCSSALSLLYVPDLKSICDYWKNYSFGLLTFVGHVKSLIFNTVSKFVIAFLLWLHSVSTLILEPKIMKSGTIITVSPPICHQVRGPDALILVFWMLRFSFFFLCLFFF